MSDSIWSMSIYPDGTINEYRRCPDCSEFLQNHSSLSTNIKQKKKSDGTWYHVSPHGRMLHKLMLKKGGAE